MKLSGLLSSPCSAFGNVRLYFWPARSIYSEQKQTKHNNRVQSELKQAEHNASAGWGGQREGRCNRESVDWFHSVLLVLSVLN